MARILPPPRTVRTLQANKTHWSYTVIWKGMLLVNDIREITQVKESSRLRVEKEKSAFHSPFQSHSLGVPHVSIRFRGEAIGAAY